MAADLLSILVWSVFLWTAVGTSAHLYRHLGVLVASQATLMTLAGFVDTLLLKKGMSPMFSWLMAVVSSAGLGVMHVPILLQTRPALLLVLTAISQLVLVEVWYAAPDLTGGSGGLLLPGTDAITAMFTLIVLGGVVVLYFYRAITSTKHDFSWACIRTLGPKAEAFGVPCIKLYIIGFVAYGILLGASGVAATRLLGYLSINSFGLSWSLATVMIVLVVPRLSIIGSLTLCLIYTAIRVMLRQSVYASVTASAIFEIMFPLILLVLIHVQHQFPRPSNSRINQTSPREA